MQVLKNQRRYLNLLEYQSKALLQDSGVAIQEFCVLDGVQGDNTKCLQNFSNYLFFSFFRLIFVNKNINTLMVVLNICSYLRWFTEVPEYVVKAQILAGGRGKGHFDTGFKGGVHITKK